MSLIRKSTELNIPTNVKMMIYGQAGMGKSTVALSAPKPLLLDFDNGVKRMNMAHLENIDTVQVTSWNDVQLVLQEDLSVYQTIVVDTIGKMMDFIITYKCGTRQPSIRDWGGINAEFSWMTRTLSSLRKHIIFVAHRDTRKEGDDTVFIPALREKSYNSIVTELDLLGYLEMKSERGVQRWKYLPSLTKTAIRRPRMILSLLGLLLHILLCCNQKRLNKKHITKCYLI